VRVLGVVTPDGLTREARDARDQLVAAEARLRLASQETMRRRALSPGDVSPRKELEAAIAEETSARAAADRARQIASSLGDTEPAAAPRGAVWLVAQVPQEVVELVLAGSPAHFTADVLERPTFAAEVTTAPSYVDPASRSAPVRVRAFDPDGRLVPGMTGSVAIEAGTVRNAVVVPEAAVVYDEHRALVFAGDEHGGFTQSPIVVGVVRDGVVEIVEGLTPGTRVATTGASSLLSAARLATGSGD